MAGLTERGTGMKAVIDACLDCYKECMGTAMTHCLMEGGAHVDPKHFRLMMACAEVCKTCASLMLMGSPHHVAMCGECVSICNECADSCDALGGPEMQECADNCRLCAQLCGEMGGTRIAA